jgi:hypothetical protein
MDTFDKWLTNYDLANYFKMSRTKLYGMDRRSDLFTLSKTKRTTNLASINSKEVAGLPVPDASISQQEKLPSGLSSQTEAATNKRTEAETLRQTAWTAFESALFTAGKAAA